MLGASLLPPSVPTRPITLPRGELLGVLGREGSPTEPAKLPNSFWIQVILVPPDLQGVTAKASRETRDLWASQAHQAHLELSGTQGHQVLR